MIVSSLLTILMIIVLCNTRPIGSWVGCPFACQLIIRIDILDLML